MKNWRNRLDVVANLALIACCVLVFSLLTRNYLRARSPEVNTVPKELLVGKTLANTGINWSESEKTLLLVLQKGCRFCDESMPFYQRLSNEVSVQPKVRLIALLPDSDDENRKYLGSKMLKISDVRRASARSLGVKGTPSLVLVDKTGAVVEQWLGKLQPAEEDAVMARLKQ